MKSARKKPSDGGVRSGFLVVSTSQDAGQRLRQDLVAATGDLAVLVTSLADDLPQTIPRPAVTIIWVRPAEVMANVAAANRAGHPVVIVVGDVPANVAFEAAFVGADALVIGPACAERLLSVVQGVAEPTSKARSIASLARAEWEYIQSVLALCGGNRSATARHLNIHRSVLQRKLSRFPPRW